MGEFDKCVDEFNYSEGFFEPRMHVNNLKYDQLLVLHSVPVPTKFPRNSWLDEYFVEISRGCASVRNAPLSPESRYFLFSCILRAAGPIYLSLSSFCSL